MRYVLIGVLSVLVVGLIGIAIVTRGLWGAPAPTDLGITVDDAAISRAKEKTTVEYLTLPADTPIEQSIRYEGTKSVSYSLDSSEVSALAQNHERYVHFPFRSVQIRINPDGTLDASGIVRIGAALKYAKAIGYRSSDLDNVINKYKIPARDLAFAVHGTGEVTNGDLTVDLQSASIAGISVPIGLISDHLPAIEGVIERGITSTPGLKIKSLRVSDGKIVFDGNVPEKEYLAQ